MGGGVRHYFMVEDVEHHFRQATKIGIEPEPNEIERRPWLDFFTVSDPDNHQIVIAQKHEAYFEEAAEEIRKLREAQE